MNTVAFSKAVNLRGSNQTRTDVHIDLNGYAYGAIYTYKDTKDEWHPWHLVTLTGGQKTFGGKAYQTAEDKNVPSSMRSCSRTTKSKPKEHDMNYYKIVYFLEGTKQLCTAWEYARGVEEIEEAYAGRLLVSIEEYTD